jgi:hypothetical protein
VKGILELTYFKGLEGEGPGGYQQEWEHLSARWSPLERHEHRYKALLREEALNKLESKQPYLVPAWWIPLDTEIAESDIPDL